jgi:CLN3 protein
MSTLSENNATFAAAPRVDFHCEWRSSCRCWFGLGMLNNLPYVIMLSSAKYMVEGGVGAVYMVNTIPGLFVKLSAPYWFDRVSYRIRLAGASICMAGAFVVTAHYCRDDLTISSRDRMVGQVIGVGLVSVQIGLGEATLLALAGKMDTERSLLASTSSGNNTSLLAFASGTGLAGPMGFLWNVAITEWLGLSVTFMLRIATFFSVFYFGLFCLAMSDATTANSSFYASDFFPRDPLQDFHLCRLDDDDEAEDEQELVHYHHTSVVRPENGLLETCTVPRRNKTFFSTPFSDDTEIEGASFEHPATKRVSDMTFRERFQLVVSLWPYIVPLFCVYAAEYALQAGAWTAIGFPSVASVQSRKQFYVLANWLYQTGSFLARSSGAFFTLSLKGLCCLPLLQLINLIFFSVVGAVHGLFYSKPLLLLLSFYSGFLGGAVYVGGYVRIATDLPSEHTEFALASTCVAEAFGVLAADVTGLFLQSCLYTWNGLANLTLVTCPL